LNAAAAGETGGKTATGTRGAHFVAAPTSPSANPALEATAEPQPISDIEKVRQLLNIPSAPVLARRTSATRGRRRTPTRAAATRRSRRADRRPR
jgi:hypothetical protein